MFFKNIKVNVAEPTEMDVLCGSKSKAVATHPGNQLLAEKVEESLNAYQQATNKQERITINRSVIQFMRRKYGSRFLKQNRDGSWSVAEEQAVRDKVSHAIRHALAKRKKSNAPPASYTVEDIKNYNMFEDAEDIETRKNISRMFDRQQEILGEMMQTTGDEKRSSVEDVSTHGDVGNAIEDSSCDSGSLSRSSSLSHEEVMGFLADIL